MFETTLTELLYGKGAHANPDRLCRRPPRRSRLAHDRRLPPFHLAARQPHELLDGLRTPPHRRRQRNLIRNTPPASWLPNSAPPSDADWTQAVARFRDLIATLAELAQSGTQSLSREVQPPTSSNLRHSSTVGAILWQIVAHNSYHTGQIAMLRRCLGAWPPAAGGDTW